MTSINRKVSVEFILEIRFNTNRRFLHYFQVKSVCLFFFAQCWFQKYFSGTTVWMFRCSCWSQVTGGLLQKHSWQPGYLFLLLCVCAHTRSLMSDLINPIVAPDNALLKAKSLWCCRINETIPVQGGFMEFSEAAGSGSKMKGTHSVVSQLQLSVFPPARL